MSAAPDPIRIAMWSGPRNISTAMMRSFGARPDCVVSDEPFYGAFLKASGAPHPMADQIIADMDCDWHSVLATQSGAVPNGGAAPIWYQKHMAHHMIGPVGIADMPDHRHAFLIRAPERVAAIFRGFDLDQDGKITLDEIIAGAQKLHRTFSREANQGVDMDKASEHVHI